MTWLFVSCPPSVVFPMSFASGESVSLCVRQSRPNLGQRRGSSVAWVSGWASAGRQRIDSTRPQSLMDKRCPQLGLAQFFLSIFRNPRTATQPRLGTRKTDDWWPS